MVIIGIERKCLWTRNHNKGEVSGDWSVRSRSLIIAAGVAAARAYTWHLLCARSCWVLEIHKRSAKV